MRRADRLFQIVQNLHTTRRVTAKKLADILEVSERTIYRDMQDLTLSGIPITGEAGQGYCLLKGFQLPPLMFTEQEIEALLIGAKMVRAWTDKELAGAAHQALQKIEHVIPEKLKPQLERNDMIVPDFPMEGQASEQLQLLRKAIRHTYKVSLHYCRADGEQSHRVIHPLGLFYWGKVWTVVGWCEMRDNFRHFRLDRILSCEQSTTHFQSIAGRTLDDYLSLEECTN